MNTKFGKELFLNNFLFFCRIVVGIVEIVEQAKVNEFLFRFDLNIQRTLEELFCEIFIVLKSTLFNSLNY